MSIKRSKRDSRGFPRNKAEKAPLGSYFYIVIGQKFYKGIGNTRKEVSAPATTKFKAINTTNPGNKTIKTVVRGPFMLFTDDREQAKKFRTQLQANKVIDMINQKFPELCDPDLCFYDKERKTNRRLQRTRR